MRILGRKWRAGAVAAVSVRMVLGAVIAALGAGSGARAAGGSDAEARALDPIAAHIRAQPAGPGDLLLGAAVSEIGHWTLVNQAGERMTASTAAELARVLATLAPVPSTDASEQPRLTLLLSEATLFGSREALRGLPKSAALQTMVDATVYPLLKGRSGTDPADALFVEVRPRVVVAVSDRPAFDEAIWQLARPLKRADVRTVSLEPGGPRSLSPVARIDAATGRPAADVIDPAALAGALAILRGQTVIVTGQTVDGRLLSRAGIGLGLSRDASIGLAELDRAATDADVDLVVLRSSSSRQPGSRNWLYLRVEVRGLASAIDRTSLGDFLTALMPSDTEMRLAAKLVDDRRTLMTATTVPIAASALGAGLSGAVGDALSTAVTTVTGQITPIGIDATMRSRARNRELDRRLLPGIHSVGQWGFLVLIAAGLGGLPMARRWFGRVWPAERRDKYDGASGYLAARAIRGAVFVAVALPLLAIPAVVATVVGKLRPIGRSPPSTAAAS